MTVLIDARPPGLDLLFRPGEDLTVQLVWPAGVLAGRSFEAGLDAAALTVEVVGDAMTVTATAVQTAAAGPSGKFVLVETTGGVDRDVIVGQWSPSLAAAITHTATVTVTDGEATVAVTVVESGSYQAVQAVQAALAADPFTVNGDVVIPGVIRTGTFGSPATFGGIEREGRVFPAGEMMSPTAVINFGDGFPRLSLPDGVTTHVYMIVEMEEWWLDSTIGVYFEWSNDHTAGGNVRWDCQMRECDIATETMAAAGVIASNTFTATAPSPNVATTSIVGRVLDGNPISMDPGPFASFYVLRISRLGADAADTLAGPVGLIAASMTRGQ